MERCLHYISQRLYLRKDAVIRPSVPDAAWLSASLSRFAQTLPAQPARHFSQNKAAGLYPLFKWSGYLSCGMSRRHPKLGLRAKRGVRMLRVKAAACRWSKRTASSLRQVSAPSGYKQRSEILQII